MMGKITLSGAIPGDNNDGIGPHSKDIVDEAQRRADAGLPVQLYNVVARFAVAKIVVNTETGVRYPVLKFHHWELVLDGDQAAFGELIGGAFGARTGAQELPFPADEVPLKDPFPEEAAEEARQAVEDLEHEDGDGPDDELAAPRARRKS
jgi:hypothetical protein